MKFKALSIICLVCITPLAACNKKNDFIDALKADRVTCSDSRRVIKVVESKMYRESHSGKDEYVSLFNYLLDHKNEEFDEGISGKLYEMFMTYPNKSKEFEDYLNLLPECSQNKILKDLTALISFEFRYVHYGKSLEEMKELFYSQFYFLASRQVSNDEFLYLLNENPGM